MYSIDYWLIQFDLFFFSINIFRVGSHNQQKTESLTFNKNGDNSFSVNVDKYSDNNKYVAKVKNSGSKLIAQQFRALLIKRILYSYRNPVLTITQFILPILILISTLLMMRTIPQLAAFRKLTMSLNQFHNPLVKYFVHNDNLSLSLAKDYEDVLKHEIRSDRIIGK